MGKYSLIHTCTKIYVIPLRGIFPLLWCEVSFLFPSALLKVFTLSHTFINQQQGLLCHQLIRSNPSHIATQITMVPLWKQFGVRYLTQGPFILRPFRQNNNLHDWTRFEFLNKNNCFSCFIITRWNHKVKCSWGIFGSAACVAKQYSKLSEDPMLLTCDVKFLHNILRYRKRVTGNSICTWHNNNCSCYCRATGSLWGSIASVCSSVWSGSNGSVVELLALSVRAVADLTALYAWES